MKPSHKWLQRCVLPALALTMAAALLTAVAASAGDPGAGSAARFRAKLHTAGSKPVANRVWNFRVRVTDSRGRPLKSRIDFAFLFNGHKVAEGPRCKGSFKQQGRCIYVHKSTRFRGTFRDFVCLTPASAGIHLTFRVNVRTTRGRKALKRRIVTNTGPRRKTKACRRPTRKKP